MNLFTSIYVNHKYFNQNNTLKWLKSEYGSVYNIQFLYYFSLAFSPGKSVSTVFQKPTVTLMSH